MSTVQISKYIVGPIKTNEYLVYDTENLIGIVIDPGAESESIHNDIKRLGLDIKYIILTHGHGDHTGGIDQMKSMYPDIKLIANKKERNFLFDRDKSMGKGGYVADIYVSDNDTLSIGNISLKFIDTPGHTPGGMCILMDKVLFSGDSLFFGSIGRTDLPGGNEEQLIESIKNKILVLDDDVKVFPGHMQETSIGFERSFNPFV